MEIKFQFNKTALQAIAKDLQVRERALPTLHAKESALRAEVKRVKERIRELQNRIDEELGNAGSAARLWSEFPDILTLSGVKTKKRNIAGVKVPELENIDFNVRRFSLFSGPTWTMEGLEIIKNLSRLRVEIKVVREELKILERARRKTTQKVNLYEKVQIPAFEEAIRKIKRFLEDEENLAKSAQKLLKARKAERVFA